MEPTIFNIPELPGIDFEVVRGGVNSEGEQNHPAWIQITSKDENGVELTSVGFLGP